MEPLQQLFVDFDVFVGTVGPAVVAGHAAFLQQLDKFGLLSVAGEGAADDMEHIVGIVVQEGEAVALARCTRCRLSTVSRRPPVSRTTGSVP